MYLEKKLVLDKIDEYCKLYDISLTTDEKFDLASNTLKKLDNHRVLDYDNFIDLLNHNIELEQNDDVDFNDEIVSIEYIGEEEMYDIDVTGNHLYYANSILTHNSAVNNTEADNSAVADSIGTVQTADFLCFMLQTEEMKERNEIHFKITKNRFNGLTDHFTMSVDYTKMRFHDVIESNNPNGKAKVQADIDFELEKERILAQEAVNKSQQTQQTIEGWL